MTHPDSDTIAFVHDNLRHYCERMRGLFEDAPPEIRAELSADVATDPIPSNDPLYLQQVDAFAKRLALHLPPVFQAYLLFAPFRAVEWAEMILPRLDGTDPLADAQGLLDQPELLKLGYAQCAYGPCGDPVCFDLLDPLSDGDFAIVAFNHDLIPYNAWKARETLSSHAERLAASFADLLRRLCWDEPLG